MSAAILHPLSAILCLCLCLTAPAVTLSTPTVSDVTPTGFTVVWETSEPSAPGLDLFTDPEGATPVSGQTRLEFTPLALGDVAARSTPDSRAGRRALAQLVAGRNLALARVSGLAPGSTVYFRPRTYDLATGADNFTGLALAPTGVDLAETTAFVADAQLLAIDFAGAGATGLVAVLSGPAGTVPLTAVVGDGPTPDVALFSLADIASSALATNAAFDGPVEFTVTLLGDGAPADALTHTVTFQTTSAVPAGFGTATFSAGGVPAYFVFDPITDQDAGLGFTITVRAMTSDDAPMTTYAGTATITGSAALASGAGESTLFTAGVLAGHPVMIDRGGEFTLTASAGASTGTSNAFAVRDNSGAWANTQFSPAQLADPAQSGLTADPGGLGLPNLLRYAFATGVAAPDRTRLPVAGVTADGADNYLSISFRRLAHASDVVYRVEASSDLLTWTLVEAVMPGLPELVTVRDTVPFNPAVRRFLRVNVVHAETYAGYLNRTASAEVRADPAQHADSADPGAHGIPNLLRYAFGLDHAAPSPAELPQATTVSEGGATYLALAFERLPEGAGVRYVVQASANLVTWTTLEIVLPGSPAAVVVRDTQPAGAGQPRFLRVLVERTTP